MTQNPEDKSQNPTLIELLTIDSTNNYALEQLRAGLAYHGLGVFAHEQVAGKGQRGKKWVTEPGKNLHLSVILDPKSLILDDLFILSAFVAVTTRDFLNERVAGDWNIKWPNDIYFQDRKAVGMLIENVISGNQWKWAVVGIGVNVNQETFPDTLDRAVSLRQVSGETFECLQLAKDLAAKIVAAYDQLIADPENRFAEVLHTYNRFLFKKGQTVHFKDAAGTFEAQVMHVTQDGTLLLKGAPKPGYQFGELEWTLSK